MRRLILLIAILLSFVAQDSYASFTNPSIGNSNLLCNPSFEFKEATGTCVPYDQTSGTNAEGWIETTSTRTTTNCRTGTYCMNTAVQTPTIQNPDFTALTGWSCVANCGAGTANTGDYITGNPSPWNIYELRHRSTANGSVMIIEQGPLTITASVAYEVKIYFNDAAASYAPSLTVRSASGNGGVQICSTTPAVAASGWVSVTCNILNSNTYTSIYVQTRWSRTTYAYADGVTVQSAGIASVVSPAVTVSSYDTLMAYGWVKGSGSTTLSILDQSDVLIPGCIATMSASAIYQKVSTTCSRGSATSAKIKVEAGEYWDDVGLYTTSTVAGLSSGQKVSLIDRTGAEIDSTVSTGSSVVLNPDIGWGLDGALSGFSDPPTSTSGWQTLCKLGNCLAFDGSNDYITVSSSPLLSINSGTDPMSIEFWVKRNGIPGSDSWFFSQWSSGVTNRLLIGIKATTGYISYSKGGYVEVVGNVNVANNNWHHVAITKGNTGTVKIYVDNQGTPPSGTDTNVFLNVPNYLGTDPVAVTSLAIQIDSFAIYNYELSAANVSTQYNSGVGYPCNANFFATVCLRLDESSGTVATNGGNRDSIITVTDTDSKTFLDQSAWHIINGGSSTTWSNSNLTKDATWGIAVVGDSDSDGSCVDSPDTGCYVKFTRNGSDYMFQGPALGTNLASGKTASASSNPYGNVGNVIDGLYWQDYGTDTAVPQWVCINLGSALTFNRIHLVAGTTADLTYYGKDMKIQTSTVGCNSSMVDVPNTSITRNEFSPLTIFTFAEQTKRYVRIYVTNGYTAGWLSMTEFEIYNEGSGNAYTDFEHIFHYSIGDGFTYPKTNVRYNSYINESDGSITLSGTSGLDNTLSLTVNYKKVHDDVWRKRVTLNSSVASKVEIRSSLLRYNSDTCYGFPNERDPYSCVTANHDMQEGYQSVGIGYPYVFGLTADSGCNAEWTLIDLTPSSTFIDNRDLTGVNMGSTWSSAYVTYGRNYDYKQQFDLPASTNKTFDFVIFRSLDPSHRGTQKVSGQSLAYSKDLIFSDEYGGVLWSGAYQLNRLPISSRNDFCFQLASQFYTYANNALFPTDSIWTALGLRDQKGSQKLLSAWQKAVSLGAGAYIKWEGTVGYDDALNLSPPVLTGSGRYSPLIASLVADMYKRGWVTISATCSSTETCVTTQAISNLLTDVEADLSSGGWGENGIGVFEFDEDMVYWDNITDFGAYDLGWRIVGLRSMKYLGQSINETKLANAKTNYASLYNATDGYIHPYRYGHWRPVAHASASGSQYYLAQGDWVGPSTSRFVAPVTGTLTVYSTKDNYAGKMAIKLNGTPVSGSPFDLSTSAPITWTSLTNTTATPNANDLKKTSGSAAWDADAVSTQQISSFQYGAGVSAKGGQTNKQVLFGLSADDPNASYTDIDYAIDVNLNADIYIFENGTDKTSTLGCGSITYTTSDVFSIRLNSEGYPEYRKNNVVLCTSVTLPSYPLFVDTSIYDVNASIIDVNMITSETPSYQQNIASFSVTASDVVTFEVTDQKNALSLAHKINVDKVTIGANTYEETNAAFQCGSVTWDCLSGYSLGWKRWKVGGIALWGEYVMRNMFGESMLTDQQVRNHISNTPTGNNGNGVLLDYMMDENDICVSPYYFDTVGGEIGGNWRPCGTQRNGGSHWLFNGYSLVLASSLMLDNPLDYKWDEKNDKFTMSGSWSNEEDIANYYMRYVWVSSTAGDYIEFKNVEYNNAYVYMITGGGQGSVKIYFDSGAGYDAGTTIDLSTASNPVYSKTSQTYSGIYKIKMEVLSGAVRLDYITTKTKASFLLEERLKEEFYEGYYGKEWISTKYTDPYYRSYDPAHGDAHYGYNIFYKSLSLIFQKSRGMFQGIYNRRVE